LPIPRDAPVITTVKAIPIVYAYFAKVSTHY
jgi:hypothetical protein